MTYDLTGIESAVASLATSLPVIQTGVANFRAQNEAQAALIDPTLQTWLNTVSQSLSQVAALAQTVASNMPVIPPPGTPGQ